MTILTITDEIVSQIYVDCDCENIFDKAVIDIATDVDLNVT